MAKINNVDKLLRQHHSFYRRVSLSYNFLHDHIKTLRRLAPLPCSIKGVSPPPSKDTKTHQNTSAHIHHLSLCLSIYLFLSPLTLSLPLLSLSRGREDSFSGQFSFARGMVLPLAIIPLPFSRFS